MHFLINLINLQSISLDDVSKSTFKNEHATTITGTADSVGDSGDLSLLSTFGRYKGLTG